MTEQTQPTDAEILDAADDFRSQYKHGGTTFDEFDALGFARAVLAKWGTPAGAAPVTKERFSEPLARVINAGYLLANCAFNMAQRPGTEISIGTAQTLSDCRKEWDAACAAHKALPPAPQPTQAQAGAVPPESEAIVRNCEAPGDLKLGDYVFASRWSDCDPGDPWEVGFVSEVGVYQGSMTKAGYVVLQGGSRRWGRAMRITPEQGRRICEQFPSMERLPQDYDAIARVFGIKGGQHG